MGNENDIEVWDLGVRIFHWTLVVSFVSAYLTGEVEGDIHIYLGYLIVALLCFRIVWGLVGSRHARFSDFIYSPAETLNYLKSLRQGKARRYLGHNPLGGWMVVAMLTMLIAISWSGLELYALDGKGPLAGWQGGIIAEARADDDHDDEGESAAEEFLEEIHEFFSNLMVLMVLLHISGVVLSSRLHGESLVKAMLTGKKARTLDKH